MLKLRVITEELLPYSLDDWPFDLPDNLPYKYIRVDSATDDEIRRGGYGYLSNIFALISEKYGVKRREINMVLVLSPEFDEPERIEDIPIDEYNEDMVLVVKFWEHRK